MNESSTNLFILSAFLTLRREAFVLGLRTNWENLTEEDLLAINTELNDIQIAQRFEEILN